MNLPMYLRTLTLGTLAVMMSTAAFFSLMPTLYAQTPTCVGVVPQNAHIYPGDDQGLTENTALGYRSYNEPSIKCDYTCNTGYIWDAATWTCNPPGGVYVCEGSIPANATAWGADETQDLNFATSWSEHSIDTAVKCQFGCNSGYYWNGTSCQSTTCSAGYFWNGNGCFAIPTGPRCIGSLPENAERYNAIADDTVSENTPMTYGAYDSEVKCQFRCKEGFEWDGVSKCRAPGSVVTYSCTGTLPTNAEGYTGDAAGLVANNSWVYTSSNTSRSCEFFCKTGYRHMASSNTCELIPGSGVLSGAANSNTPADLINPNACSFRISIPNTVSGFVDVLVSMLPWR